MNRTLLEAGASIPSAPLHQSGKKGVLSIILLVLFLSLNSVSYHGTPSSMDSTTELQYPIRVNASSLAIIFGKTKLMGYMFCGLNPSISQIIGLSGTITLA